MKLAEITPEARFDNALATAEGWRLDARLYTGRRRKVRLEHAKRMERIAGQIVRDA